MTRAMSEGEFLTRVHDGAGSVPSEVAAAAIDEFCASRDIVDVGRWLTRRLFAEEARRDAFEFECMYIGESDELTEVRAALKGVVNALNEDRVDDAKKLASEVKL